MEPYSLRSAQITLDSSIAAMVLLNPDATDVEFWPLRPTCAAPGALTGPAEFTARRLCVVGVVGLSGAKALCAFKEPLATPVVAAISEAFTYYCRVLLGENFTEQMAAQLEQQQAGDFVQFAEALWSLEDARPEK